MRRGLFQRFGMLLFLGSIVAVVAACGGGGGGGGGYTPPGTVAPSTGPSPLATPQSTATLTPSTTTATTATVTASNAVAATLQFPTLAAGSASGSIGIAGLAAVPSGATPLSRRAKSQVVTKALPSNSTVWMYVAVTPSVSMTFTGQPVLSFTASGIGTAAGQFYIAFCGPGSNCSWVEPAAGPGVLSGAGNNTVTFTPGTGSYPVVGNQVYQFVLYSTTAVAPTSAPTSAPTPAPTAAPSGAPTTSPTGAIEVIAAQGNVVRGSASAGVTTAMVAAISMAGDQTAPGGNGTFATTNLRLGSGTSAQLAGRLSMVRAPIQITARSPVEVHPADDRALRAQVMRVPHMALAGAPVVRRATSTIPANATIGSTANIWTAVFAIGGGSASYQQVPATLEAQTAHGNIWIDSSLISGSNSSPSFNAGNATQTAGTIAADFENAYVSDTTHFGTPHYASTAPGLQVQYATCSATGVQTGSSAAQYIAEPTDQRIDVMVLNSANLGSGVGGYFSSLNYYPQSIVNCFAASNSATPQYSNEAPMVYVGWFQSDGAAYELGEDLVRGTGHEFQHLINFVNHSILASGANSPTYDGSEDSFINEGLSMLAQDLAVNAMYPSVPFDSLDALEHAAAYLNAPQNFSISGFIGIDSAPYGDGSTVAYNCGGGCYGGAYLFQRYMRDRFGGDTYTRGMENSGITGFANLVANCGCNETAPGLLQDFALAMSADTVGLTGQSAPYSFGTLDIRHGRYPSPLSLYQSPDLTGLNAMALLPNTAGTATAPVGGFAFFELSSPASEAFSVTDTTPTAGFGLLGGLAQH